MPGSGLTAMGAAIMSREEKKKKTVEFGKARIFGDFRKPTKTPRVLCHEMQCDVAWRGMVGQEGGRGGERRRG